MAYEMTPFEKEMEEKLLEMRSELLHKIAKSDDEFRTLVGPTGGRDSIDLACDDMVSKKMETISKMDAGRLNAVDQALIRIRNGKYGICASCGQQIPEGRLRAIPYALLCIDCKSKTERRQKLKRFLQKPLKSFARTFKYLGFFLK